MRNIFVMFTMIGLMMYIVGCPPQRTSNADGKDSATSNANPSDASLPPAKSSPVTSMGIAQFAYVVSDEAGTPVIKGTLILPWPPAEGGGFQGTWQAKYSSNDEVSPANKLGPQTGGGRCAGELSSGRLRLNLNPGMNDNNVFFNLVMGEREMKGDWTYSTFAGPTAKGTVVATRE